MNIMSTVPLSLRIDSEIRERIEVEAEKMDRPSSYVVVEAIKQYLNKKDYKREALKTAIERADKGEFISQESMREWFASLGSDNQLPRPKPDVFLKK